MVTRDYSFIKDGAKVRWGDPAIYDFEPPYREGQMNMVWEVYGCLFDIKEDDDIVCISCGEIGEIGYSEAEVLACELYPIEN